MKAHYLLPVTVVVSVALLGVVRIRKKEQDKATRRDKFQDIKLRVTYDVLREYQADKAETQVLLEKRELEHTELVRAVDMYQAKASKAKGDADVCKGDQKSARDELASTETKLKLLQVEVDKEMTSLRTETATLKQQLEARSAVCDFLKKGSEAARQLCINEEPKAEAPKQDEPKAEAPKQDEPKAKDPKQDEPKAEAPKQDEPKAEAPKQEEPKAEAPKQDEPKAEAPKQDEPKAEAPKQDEPKAEAPKQNEPKAEAPKQEEPKAEAPKQEEPKAEAPKQEEPKAEAPKQEVKVHDKL